MCGRRADPDGLAEDGQEELALGAAAAKPLEEAVEGTSVEGPQRLFLELCLLAKGRQERRIGCKVFAAGNK